MAPKVKRPNKRVQGALLQLGESVLRFFPPVSDMGKDTQTPWVSSKDRKTDEQCSSEPVPAHSGIL